ncbi:hypothetical protein BDW59DRAFT_162610 [Aspergillus cavernicola]|uniref:NAD(P)-binding domain-containing protein n=1 Tax=Aspergillus cavernicola TaxID=176166 RepID=A0ABR4I942_9EURO
MRVLVFGGNGRIARSMTQLMLARAWDVTSVIRNPRQEANILALGQGQPGHIDVLHYDLHDLKTSTEAVEILDKTNPTCVIFAAGSFSSVYQIDRDAAKSIIKAATTTTSVLKFLMISFPAARRTPAPWWDDKDIRNYHAEKSSYPDIAEAKIQADEYLIAMTNARHGVRQVSIADVAAVAVEMLSRDDVCGWVDLLEGGGEGIAEAVERVVRDRVDCVEREDVGAMGGPFNLDLAHYPARI